MLSLGGQTLKKEKKIEGLNILFLIQYFPKILR
jgi:hypothetical protein